MFTMKIFKHNQFRLNFTYKVYFLIFLGLNLTLLMPSIISNVIQHDDYNFFRLNNHSKFFLTHPQAIYGYYFGRPIQSLLVDFFAVLFPYIGFNGLRLIGAILFSSCATRIYFCVNSVSSNKNTGLFIAFSFCLLPGTIFSELLLVAIPFSVAILFALESGRLINSKTLVCSKNKLILFLLILSFLTYQPASVMFFFYPFIKQIHNGLNCKEACSRLFIFLSAAFVYFLSVKFVSEPFLLKHFPGDSHVISSSSPYVTQLASNPGIIIEKFIRVIKTSLSFFFPAGKVNYFGYLILLPLFFNIYLKSKNILRSLFYTSGIIIFITFVFSLPILAAKNSLIFFRTTNYVTLAFIALGMVMIEKIGITLKKNLNILKFCIISSMFLSSFWLAYSSASFTNSEYISFKYAHQNSLSYVPNTSKVINDEFYMPITSTELAEKRIAEEISGFHNFIK